MPRIPILSIVGSRICTPYSRPICKSAKMIGEHFAYHLLMQRFEVIRRNHFEMGQEWHYQLESNHEVLDIAFMGFRASREIYEVGFFLNFSATCLLQQGTE